MPTNKWNLIDEEWATELVGLRMKVRGLFWNGCTDKQKRTFMGVLSQNIIMIKKDG